MLWDKVKELANLEKVEVEQRGVETDLKVIERMLQLDVEAGLVCNRVASVR